MELLPLLHLLSIILICVRNWLFCAVVARLKRELELLLELRLELKLRRKPNPKLCVYGNFPMTWVLALAWARVWACFGLLVYTYFARRWLGQKLPRLGWGSRAKQTTLVTLCGIDGCALWRAISTRMPQLNNLTRLGASFFWLELAANKANSLPANPLELDWDGDAIRCGGAHGALTYLLCIWVWVGASRQAHQLAGARVIKYWSKQLDADTDTDREIQIQSTNNWCNCSSSSSGSKCCYKLWKPLLLLLLLL